MLPPLLVCRHQLIDVHQPGSTDSLFSGKGEISFPQLREPRHSDMKDGRVHRITFGNFFDPFKEDSITRDIQYTLFLPLPFQDKTQYMPRYTVQLLIGTMHARRTG